MIKKVKSLGLQVLVNQPVISPTPTIQPVQGTIRADKTSGPAPLAVTFGLAITGGQVQLDQPVFWNFGDGTTSTGDSTMTVSHTFTTPGTYTVTAVVQGTDAKTYTLSGNKIGALGEGMSFQKLLIGAMAILPIALALSFVLPVLLRRR